MSDIDYAWGFPYELFWLEARPLVEAHWNEAGTFRHALSLRPDHERYLALERAKVLHILTARRDGAIVGYFLLHVTKHPRDVTAKIGMDDAMFALPSVRRFLVGHKMRTMAMERCKELGADVIYFRHKADRQGDAWLKANGFEPIELVFGKALKKAHEVAA